jgi:hypothetical protein
MLLGLLGLGLESVVAPEIGAQTTNSVGGQAFSTYVKTPIATLAAAPLATLPAGGGMGEGELAAVDVAGILKAGALRAVTTGVIGENASSAQSMAAASDVNILNGVVTATTVIAMASSASNGIQATGNNAGSTIVDLVVNGLSMGVVSPAPNTIINVPAVGTVILNEQVFTGDGITNRGLAVNMIHVILQDAVTGAKTGDIIVGGAASNVSFVR